MAQTPSSNAPQVPTAARPTLHERRTYVPAYAHEQFIVPLLSRRIERALREIAASIAFPATVLDAGCGESPMRAELIDLGFEYRAMDFQQNSAGTVDYVCSIESPLPDILAKQRFDLIVCTEVLEHVADWHAAFANFRELLAPAGSLLITVPHSFPLHEEPFDFWRPTLHAIRHFAALYGLEVSVAEKLGNGWDMMGTTLAMGNPPSGPRSVSARVTARLGRAARSAVVPIFKLASRLSWRPPGVVYMSNFAVLTKPA